MKKIKIELKWGVIFFLMGLVWMALERAAGLHDEHIAVHSIYTNFVAIPAILIYVLALLEKRKKFFNGVMNYKQGFITGFKVTLIITALTPLSQYLVSTIITPHYFTNAIQYAIDTEVMKLDQAIAFFNVSSYIFQATIMALIMGVLTTAVVAIFLRKKTQKL